jgi:hypothetical protein
MIADMGMNEHFVSEMTHTLTLSLQMPFCSWWGGAAAINWMCCSWKKTRSSTDNSWLPALT